MEFIVSSNNLLNHLQAISKAIPNKSSIPLLDCFLFEIKENVLTVTASDKDTTLVTSLELNSADADCAFAIESKRLLDILRELPEQPLTFKINLDNFGIEIITGNAKYSIVGNNHEDYPQVPTINEEEKTSVIIAPDVLTMGISKTLFATADDELKPMMTGILMELFENQINFVASDSHKLVKYIRKDIENSTNISFVLPQKPANIIKTLLLKEIDDIVIEFDSKNAFFKMSNYKMICRLLEGQYPNYSSVIPPENPNLMTINREDLLSAVKRLIIFANQANFLVKFEINDNNLIMTSQDIDFSIAGEENLNCQYEGEPISIGFKATFFKEILETMTCEDVKCKMSNHEKPCILVPVDKENPDEDELMLIMPLLLE